jgi:hypothetical protein
MLRWAAGIWPCRVARRLEVMSRWRALLPGETAKELNDIEETNYQIGHQNWVTATRGLAEAPGVFAPAMSASGLAVNAGGEVAKTQNDIAAANNSWVNGAFGALGAIGGAAVTGGFGKKP